ncbi:hypothetical protein [Burkholderia cepacia]|uniref:hypothetical protein n=1 Tax=Burkholderia cepacia TaxID=292 RepID=UPI00264F17FC|nr:hypothetical protein [Burkholderia cepacia]MDN7913692.1 hypothetical protein [Burkholderia cepacia]
MRTRMIVAAVLGLSHALYMTDETAAAAGTDAPLLPATDDAAAIAASAAGESSGVASNAAAALESDTSSSAVPASLSGGTEAPGPAAGEAGNITGDPASTSGADGAEALAALAGATGDAGAGNAVAAGVALQTDSAGSLATTDAAAANPPSAGSTGAAPSGADAQGDPLPHVAIDVEDHAEARERFAGLMAKLHFFENDTVEQLRNELRAIATLLHLHSVASGTADATGDYSSSDLS